MLGFNCLTGVGRDIVPYVEAYGLLKHVKDRPSRRSTTKTRHTCLRVVGLLVGREHLGHVPHFLTELQDENA
jgi:hypothetical protein